jgi:tripartite-type tricarboxylate transporter receptor subunit TctC
MSLAISRRALLAGGLVTAFGARAQGISSRPVKIILGQTPGTTPDVIARIVAPRLGELWKQPFVVENRPGAGGAIGLEALAKSPPDGHAITVNVNATLTLPLFFKLDFDILDAFTPIAALAQNIFVLVVHPSVPARDWASFEAWARREAANANYASPGNGTHHHLIMESLKLRTGLALTHIPYKGSAPAVSDLIGGQVPTMFVPLGTALVHLPSGRMRAIGGSARERSPLAPDIASLHEQGVKDFDFRAWYSAMGPAGMAKALVERYNALFRAAMADVAIRDALAKQGLSVRLSSPEELARMNREDRDTLAKLVRDAGIKGDG